MISEERAGARFNNKEHTEPSGGPPIRISPLPPPYETLGHRIEAIMKAVPQAVFQRKPKSKKKGGCREAPSKLYLRVQLTLE